ncbi:MAG: Holliday junction resolvase RecU [Lactobacillus sp.]|jgi:recombination protein U|nr:Holliday junction resolvase RecU [Lactobacillus sp.]MCH3906285.1 Holliday junction resolvase RecU [Lactobacillus sp.]MCH3990139.1 Holliday junction resolvase RecU [Lactobacillus sp.]MCH4069147.1 Holliday junction resolvase RecU [Lactobacillus sp.]MCI1303866.1 Holliday junction resolvase RecU [Lactobacillus sp.]
MVKYPQGVSPFVSGLKQPQWSKAAPASTAKHRHRRGVNFSDRGMTLEQQLNESNKYYLSQGLAVVHKKPTPVQIVKVDYPKRSRAVIREAYFRQASTTDYNGVYQGYYLDFEAKETRNKSSFPLKNFHPHQISHLQACLDQNGICFTVLKFVTLDRYFIVPASVIIAAWQDPDHSSISLETIVSKSIELECGYRPPLPYLTAVDRLIKDRK